MSVKFTFWSATQNLRRVRRDRKAVYVVFALKSWNSSFSLTHSPLFICLPHHCLITHSSHSSFSTVLFTFLSLQQSSSSLWNDHTLITSFSFFSSLIDTPQLPLFSFCICIKAIVFSPVLLLLLLLLLLSHQATKRHLICIKIFLGFSQNSPCLTHIKLEGHIKENKDSSFLPCDTEICLWLWILPWRGEAQRVA